MKSLPTIVALFAATTCVCNVLSQETTIRIDASKVLHRVSPLLTGVCIEDVNHEIYGGLYSQMIFGESFQEPPLAIPPKGFYALGGRWEINQGVLNGSKGNGNMLVSELPPFRDAEVSVDVSFDDLDPGCAGLILRLANAKLGIDSFDGYEISLDAQLKVARLGRHHQNWFHFKDVPCEFNPHGWTKLAVNIQGNSFEVFVNDKSVAKIEDRGPESLEAGTLGLRQWQRSANYRNLVVNTSGMTKSILFEKSSEEPESEISGMWRLVQRGDASGQWKLDAENPFVGQQSQRISFEAGEGEIGIENKGLNRWGICFQEGKEYEGILWAKAEKPSTIWVAAEDSNGLEKVAEIALPVEKLDWQKISFKFVPTKTIDRGRLAISLKNPSSVTLGYASLEPGAWGRFRDLHVRRDVAEMLIEQGVTVMRYGGSMVNHPQYRWKNMIGTRDQRPPYQGFWYPYSTNGWGIIDFMSFCEAAHFEYIPTFNLNELPEDMVDFLEYAHGNGDSKWGSRRIQDGHPEPFRFKYIEIGNEERVDDSYASKFESIAKAIWAVDKEIVLVVGDFVYSQPIQDPYSFQGAASNITSLVGHERILKLAKKHDREVWFDIHVGTDGPLPDQTYHAMFSFRDALEKVSNGAKFKVLTFEFNSNNHSHKRAIANALAIQGIERDGQIPIATAANALQPDGQNDNGWNQGLLFLNPSHVWLQPTGYITKMYSENYQPLLVQCEKSALPSTVDCNAKLSEDGRKLAIFLVNPNGSKVDVKIELVGMKPQKSSASVTEMVAPLDAANSAEYPDRVKPIKRLWNHSFMTGTAVYEVPAFSVSTIELD